MVPAVDPHTLTRLDPKTTIKNLFREYCVLGIHSCESLLVPGTLLEVYPANVQQMFSGSMQAHVFSKSIVQVDPRVELIALQLVDFFLNHADSSFTTDEV